MVSSLPDLPLVDAHRIGFFFGAGASIEFGIPSMKSMTTTFAEKIRNKVSQNMGERKIFDSIYTSLAKAYGEDKVDLEAIISVIAGLKVSCKKIQIQYRYTQEFRK